MSRVTWFEVAACLKCCGVAEESKSSLQGANTQLYVLNIFPPNCSGKSLRTNTRSSNGGPIEGMEGQTLEQVALKAAQQAKLEETKKLKRAEVRLHRDESLSVHGLRKSTRRACPN
jgi:hypothetical protein